MSTYPTEMVPDIDLGHDHFLNWARWEPDDLPSNRKWLGIPDGPLPVVERWGATIRHYRPDGMLCEACIEFDGEWQRKIHAINIARAEKESKPLPKYVVWVVESWEPLTCSPSLLCKAPVYDADGTQIGTCGDHGHIRQGRWVPA